MTLLVLDSRVHVRCRKCEKRRVLPRHPDRYRRKPPSCQAPGCGHRSYRVDKWMNERNTGTRGAKAWGCVCGGYHFTHRKGSPYCLDNPLAPLLHADRQGDSINSLLRVGRDLAAQHPQHRARIAAFLGECV